MRLKALVCLSVVLIAPFTGLSALQLGGLLAGHEADFQAAGAANGVDPLLLEAIAIEESGNGTSHALQAFNNTSGMMDPNSPDQKGFLSFPSIADSINSDAALLQRGYISQGLTSISAIGDKYAPAGALNDPNGTNGNWANDVAGFYQQLGGTSTSMGTAQPGGDGMPGGGNFTHAVTPAFVDQLLQKFAAAGKGWVGVIQRAATSLFWILATISVSWTLIMLAFKKADLLEICAELCRFILFTGFFFWILTHGADFGQKIIASLWTLGGQASGSGNSIYPGDLISLGMQVLVNSSQQLVWVMVAPAAGIPFVFAVIILIICALVAVNVILLLAAAWVVLYAGIVFLGFGGCRWTSDMAVNYYRAVLGIGVSLMVLQLIVGIGVKFLQDMVASFGEHPDIPGMATIMIATIIVAVLAHRLPHMVSNIAVGSGHHTGIGAIGIMGAIGAGMAAASMARAGAAGVAGMAGAAGMSATGKMMERMSVLGTSNGNGYYPTPRPDAFATAPGSSASISQPSTAIELEEPPLEHPQSPDEQRGFEPPADWKFPDEPV